MDEEQMRAQATETSDMLNSAESQMRHLLERYIEEVWEENDFNAFQEIWMGRHVPWLGKTKDAATIVNPDYIPELIALLVRFRKISMGIQQIEQHHGMMNDPKGGETLEAARWNMGNLLRTLDEYYTYLSEHGWPGLANVPEVDDAVISDEYRDYNHPDRKVHHYLILREFLSHLRFSNEFMGKFQNVALNGGEN